MPHPFPGRQCVHHWPAGFANSATLTTLQHRVQVPQARPGTTQPSMRASSAAWAAEISGGRTTAFITRDVRRFEISKKLTTNASANLPDRQRSSVLGGEA